MIHDVAQRVVCNCLTPKVQRAVLVAALAAVLALKLVKFHPDKPTMFFIERHYCMRYTLSHWWHTCANGASCWCPSLVLLG